MSLLGLAVVSFISILSNVGSVEHLYFPVEMKSQFKPVKLEDLTCPYASDDMGFPSSVKADVQLLKTNLIRVPGTICYRQLWTIKCSENFFGVQTINKDIKDLELGHFPEKGDDKVYFPDPTCRWMSESETTAEFAICKDEEILFDETTGLGTDNQYGSFFCQKDYCPINKYVGFKPKRPLAEIIKEGFMDIEAEFSVNSRGFVDIHSLTRSHHYPRMSMKNACVRWRDHESKKKFDLILNNGFLIRFKSEFDIEVSPRLESNWVTKDYNTDDEVKKLINAKSHPNHGTHFSFQRDPWAKISDSVIKKEKFKFAHLILSLRNCEKEDDKRIKIPYIDFQTTDVEMYIESKIDQIACKRRLYEIITEKKFNLIDLGLLAPNHGGLGPVYHSYSKDISRGFGHYRRIIWDPQPEIGILGYYFDGGEQKNVTCPEWVRKNHSLSWCVNGIFKMGGKIFHPIYGADNLEELKIAFEERDVRSVEHPAILHDLHNREATTWKEYHKVTDDLRWKGVNLGIWDFFDSVIGKIVACALGGLMFLILFWVSASVIMRCCVKRSFHNPNAKRRSEEW
ncbi:glycoprotein [Sunguru virus]|uniref:Glycoprotein n=1 Tax=Sunguru virus TaxID=1491491 RepID=A0A023T326_9RHAB|nr:glycoprotein [Sunguru virus]AHX81843.1 glycoprotein [Sunguru virus]